MDWLSPAEWSAVALSLRVAFWATLASLPFALVAAHLLARCDFPGKQLFNGLVHLPLPGAPRWTVDGTDRGVCHPAMMPVSVAMRTKRKAVM